MANTPSSNDPYEGLDIQETDTANDDPYAGMDIQATSSAQPTVSDQLLNEINTASKNSPSGVQSTPLQLLGTTAAGMALAPEVEIPGLIGGGLNALSRIGSGTLANLAYQAPNINSVADLEDKGLHDVTGNTLLEIPGIIGAAIRKGADWLYPQDYTNKKIADIKNNYDAATQQQDNYYNPIMNALGNNTLTSPNTSAQYFNFGKDISKYFTPDVKKSLETFDDNPTFQNAHDLQSQMGRDIGASSAKKVSQPQALRQARNIVNNKIDNFLSTQPPEYAQNYENGRQITRDVVEPYNSSKLLQEITAGTRTQSTPENLISSLEKLSQAQKSGNALLPQNHPLRYDLADLKNRAYMGQALSTAGSSLVGGALGGLIHPEGYGGIGTGAVGGLTMAQMANLVNPKYGPGALKFIQNPFVKNLMGELAPLYYLGGNALVGATGNNS